MKAMVNICLLLSVLYIIDVQGCGRPKSTDQEENTVSSFSCECPENITIHLTIRNSIQEELFEYDVTLNTTKQTLIRHLESAAIIDPHFMFSATFFPSFKGYLINSINNLAGKWEPDRTYWEILGTDDESLLEGVSTKVPNHGERITFNFTTGRH